MIWKIMFVLSVAAALVSLAIVSWVGIVLFGKPESVVIVAGALPVASFICASFVCWEKMHDA